jgi:glycosyltransferase EpsH
VGEELSDPSKCDIIVTAWGKLFRHQLVAGIEFIDTKKIGTEDCMYNVHAFANVRSAVYLPVYGCHYRKYNAASLTTVYNTKLFPGWQYMYELMDDLIDAQQLPEVYRTALRNRRALSVLGLGVNIMAANWKPTEKRRELRRIIRLPSYREALTALDLSPMPIHWKAYFACARLGCAWGLYGLLLVIQKIRGR